MPILFFSSQFFFLRRYWPLLALLLAASAQAAPAVDGPLTPSPARRIVSLGPINTENLFLMGAGDLLVGCTTYCTRPAAAKQKEKIGTVLQPDIEKIISLEPDLILATGLTSPQQVAQFTRLGIEVVHFREPRSFAEICDNFLLMGRLTGHLPQAERLVDTARKQVEAIRHRVAALPKQKVFMQIGADPLFAAVGDTFTSDYLTFSGGINIAGGETGGQYDYERVLAHDPDIILVVVMGGENGMAGQERRKWLNYRALTAAKNRRVHVIDPDLLCSPTPVSFVRGLALVAELLHPGLRLPEEQ